MRCVFTHMYANYDVFDNIVAEYKHLSGQAYLNQLKHTLYNYTYEKEKEGRIQRISK